MSAYLTRFTLGGASIVFVRPRVAIQTIEDARNTSIAILHCIAAYPPKFENINLRNISSFQKVFPYPIGLSDHSIGVGVPLASVALGSCIIEKHFKLDEKDCGPDSSFSLNVKQLADLVNDCKEAWKAKGKSGFLRADVEQKNIIFRRSLYFVKNLSKGQVICSNDVRRIRPGYGISPKYLSEIIGKRVKINIEKGDPVKWSVLE